MALFISRYSPGFVARFEAYSPSPKFKRRLQIFTVAIGCDVYEHVKRKKLPTFFKATRPCSELTYVHYSSIPDEREDLPLPRLMQI